MDATFWAFIGLILFLVLVAYLKVPGMMAKALDERADKIRDELAEAKRLREEAQHLLAEYQRKRKEAETEAAAIIAAAEREAREKAAAEARALQNELGEWATREWEDEPEVTTAALAEWVNQWLAGLERLRWAHIEKPITSHQTTGGAAKGRPVPFARLDRDSALRDWRAQWQSLLAQGRLPAGSAPPAAGQALVPMEALLMGRGQLALAQQWGQALDQVSAGLGALTPRASERELLALTKSMKAVTVLFQNDVAAALDVPLGFSDADGD